MPSVKPPFEPVMPAEGDIGKPTIGPDAVAEKITEPRGAAPDLGPIVEDTETPVHHPIVQKGMDYMGDTKDAKKVLGNILGVPTWSETGVTHPNQPTGMVLPYVTDVPEETLFTPSAETSLKRLVIEYGESTDRIKELTEDIPFEDMQEFNDTLDRKQRIHARDVATIEEMTANIPDIEEENRERFVEKFNSTLENINSITAEHNVILGQYNSLKGSVSSELAEYGELAKELTDMHSGSNPIWENIPAEATRKLLSWSIKLGDAKVKSAVRNLLNSNLSEYYGVDALKINPTLYEAFLSGAGGSSAGLRAQTEGHVFPKIHPDSMKGVTRFMVGMGDVAGSMPAFWLGGAAGTASMSPGAGTLVGAFAMENGLRAYYGHLLEYGTADEIQEFHDIAILAGREMLLGMEIGAMTAIGARAAGFAGEVVSMTTTSHLLHGEAPTAQSFVDGFLVIGALRLMHNPTSPLKGAKVLKNLWAKTGLTPKGVESLYQKGEISVKSLDKVIAGEEAPPDMVETALKEVKKAEDNQVKLQLDLDSKKAAKALEKAVAKEQKAKDREIAKLKKAEAKELDKRVGKELDVDAMAKQTAELAKELGVPIEKVKEIFDTAVAERGKKGKEVKAKAKTKAKDKAETKKVTEDITDPVKQVKAIDDFFGKGEFDEAGAMKRAKELGLSKEDAQAIIDERLGREKVLDVDPDLDAQLGAETPKTLEPDVHPFRETDKGETDTLKTMLEKDPKKLSSPEMFSRYMVNEVNRYLNGEKVDIGKVRDTLSKMAAEADQKRDDFARRGDFDAWARNVSEAAKWAREADRPISKQSGDGVRLGTMIPVDKIPKIVMKELRFLKESFGPKAKYSDIPIELVARDYALWQKTGYWIDADGQWRFELPEPVRLTVNIGNKVREHRFKDGPLDMPLRDAVHHPKLFKVVPELENVTLRIDPKHESGGTWNYPKDRIEIWTGWPYEGDIVSVDSMRHEIQHAVDMRKGSKFIGTSVKSQVDNKLYDFLVTMAESLKDEKMIDKYEKVRDNLDREGYSEFRGKINKTIGEFRTLSKGTIDEAAVTKAFFEAIRFSGQERYMADPGEMNARLAAERGRMRQRSGREPGEPPWETLDRMLEREDVAYPKDAGKKLYSGLDPTLAKNVLKDMIRTVRGRSKNIRRVSGSQKEILENIMVLYNNEKPIEADFTYSKGVIWKGLPEPTKKFDLNPQTKDTVKMDVTNTNLKDGEISSAMYDPPFLVTPYKSQIQSETVKRFGSYETVTELVQFNREALNELFRVIEPGGNLIVKIQDVSAAGGRGNRPFLASSELYNIATRDVGFVPVNRFIYDNPNPRPPGFGSGSYHPRISDSDFWVFRKPKRGKYTPAEERGAKLYSGFGFIDGPRVMREIQSRITKLYKEDSSLSTSGFIFGDGKTANLTPKTKDGYDSTPHNEAIVEGLTTSEGLKLSAELRKASPFQDHQSGYMNLSGAIRYVNEENALNIELFNKPTDIQMKTISNAVKGNEKIIIDTPIESVTIDRKDLRRTMDELFGSEKGITLYSGIDVSKVPKELYDKGKAFKRSMNESREVKKFKPGEAAQRTRTAAVSNLLDRSGNIRRDMLKFLPEEGYKVVQAMVNAKGASSRAAKQLKQMGKEVYSGLNKPMKQVLDDVIMAARMAAIGKYKTTKQFAFPKGKDPVSSTVYLNLFKHFENLSDKQAHDIYHVKEDGTIGGRAGAYFEWMKTPLRDLFENGLISETEYNNLVKHNYRKTKLVELFDKKRESDLGAKGRNIYDSGVEALARGKEIDIYEPSSQIMALEVFNRSYGRIMNNAANLMLLDVARNDKKNPFARVRDDKNKIPSGWGKVHVFEGGKRKTMHLSPDMSREWITSSPEMTYKMSQILRYGSMSPLLRTMATGVNWGFAIANLPRDVMHTWFAAREFKDGKWQSIYNPTLPIFGAQMARDQAAVFSDAVLRKGRYDSYLDAGGGMEFLVLQGRLLQRGKHLRGPLDPTLDFLGYFGMTSEIMTRLAIRERVIRRRAREQGITMEEASKNKDIIREATFVARDYMDFSQGGSIVKVLDNGIPYLNASVQGTRGLFRALSQNPASSTYKLAQLAALTTGMYIASHKIAPKTMSALRGDVDNENNLIIPIGDNFGYLDEKGQMRYPFIKIPLDPSQRFFKVVFEALTARMMGDELDIPKLIESIKMFSPVDIGSLPPSVSAFYGYVTNKDFWLNEGIWKGTQKPAPWPESSQEFTDRTPEALIDFGELTGMSPERTKYALEQLVTRGTVWSSLAGLGYDQLFGDRPKSQSQQHLAAVFAKAPISKRLWGDTSPYSRFAEDVDKARSIDSFKRFVENRNLDTLVNGNLFHKNVERSEILKYIKSFKDRDVRDRLKERYKFSVKIKSLPNRSFWLSLQGIVSAEARAEVYVDQINKASESEREELVKGMRIVKNAGGIISREFIREVNRIRAKQLAE